MKTLQTRAAAFCAMVVFTGSVSADITFFMARQGDAAVAGPATIPLTQGESVCVNFYMSSNVTFSSSNYQFQAFSTTSPGVSVSCPSAQIDISEPSYPGYGLPVVDISGCPGAVREAGVAFPSVTITANTTYYVGELCYTATSAASGTPTISFDSDPGQTFVQNSSSVSVPIANRFGGTIVLGPAVPTLSTWGVVGLTLALLTSGTVVLKRRAAVPAT